jgi:protein-S-isoprenylcysteine O-methyltransferase Ste14
MPELALALYLIYLGLAFGLRTYVQVRSTGSTGFVGLRGRPGSVEWLGGVGFAVALMLGFAAPVIDLLGLVNPVAALDGDVAHLLGILLTVAGIAATLYAQIAMGTSWRIGVDTTERTELITAGPFALVRNPIFAAMLPTSLGLALLVPNVVALIGFVALLAALQVQTRAVEEPYLAATHGDEYTAYASRVGRFVPGLGRVRGRVSPSPTER